MVINKVKRKRPMMKRFSDTNGFFRKALMIYCLKSNIDKANRKIPKTGKIQQ
jgi:hypothetical protein